MKYVIQGGTIVSPEYIIQGAALTVENGIIKDMGQPDPNPDFRFNLQAGDLIFPGFINSHDHMLGNYYPRVGSGPYLNWKPWDNDLKSAPIYQERGQISNFDLYLLCAYRNIISGVTTIQDHIPHVVNENFIDKMPLRVIRDYTMQHEMSSYDLKWGGTATEEHDYAKKHDMPFITHVEEGFDEEAMLGIDIMQELGVLDEYSVLIHGVSLSEKDIKAIAKAKSSLVWCPTSNYFMFQETTNIKKLLEEKVNVCLGTDSPMSGGFNILEELEFAGQIYKEMYNEELNCKSLIEMITVNPAKAFRLKGLGKIEKGYRADLTIVRNGDIINPYKSLVHSWLEDIRLVVNDGVPIYGLREDFDLFQQFKKHYQLLNIEGEDRILIGKPLDLYERIWTDVKFAKTLPFFPVTMY